MRQTTVVKRKPRTPGRELKPDWRRLARLAVSAGWTYHLTARHARLVSPDGTTVALCLSASDRRSLLNTRAELRRAGLEVPR